VAAVAWAIFSICSVAAEVAEANKEIWAPRKESQSSIPLKLLLKKSTMENSLKLQLTVKEFAILAMAWAVKQELYKSAPAVRVVV